MEGRGEDGRGGRRTIRGWEVQWEVRRMTRKVKNVRE